MFRLLSASGYRVTKRCSETQVCEEIIHEGAKWFMYTSIFTFSSLLKKASLINTALYFHHAGACSSGESGLNELYCTHI